MSLATLPAVRKLTPEDFLHLPDGGRGFELIDGELVEQNVSYMSSYVAGQTFLHLAMFVGPRKLGRVVPEGTTFQCFPDNPERIRRADTAFHLAHRLPKLLARSEGICTVVPDLVVEVVSPHDLAGDDNEKRIDWQEAGAQIVWVIDPKKQTIHVYRNDGTVTLLGAKDTLTAEPLLPGFSVKVSELFELGD